MKVIRLRNSISNLTFSKNFRLFCFLLFQLFLAENKVSDTEKKCYFGFNIMLAKINTFIMISAIMASF